ncbi:flagellin N-terminal helical domain-containing protein [Paludibacterium denitrificans]|uniref:Flagellin n=1 Tax=Paludibacterium denitrificans TaxID=2675226 RepID=A0A844GCA6_9NEIS|nr:flagellin [Paludibacterium denitrificans]MTD32931.1 Lateral flagellin [Paludibacterium denitrificans]HJV05961.1 flagellin [Chromobacteriaceae bacterium]
MLSLHTNIASLNTQSALSSTQSGLTTSMTRLGTGYRINSAMDDAAGLQIATRLDAQSRGMTVAMQNTQNAKSMLQTAEGALNETSNILLRMKDLATQAADATASTADQTAMQAEYDQLGVELNNIMKNTSFGGQALLGGSGTGTGTAAGKFGASVNFQIGAATAETMAYDGSTDLNAVDTKLSAATSTYTAGNVTTAGTEISTASAANGSIQKLSDAIDAVSTLRSSFGAASNRLDHVYNNLSNEVTNTKQAQSRIMDVDYATESANMTQHQMLMQAGTAMLKQSGSMNSMVMSLLQ